MAARDDTDHLPVPGSPTLVPTRAETYDDRQRECPRRPRRGVWTGNYV